MSSTYNDLVNVASFGKKRENFELERWGLSHYCHDCKEEVAVEVVSEESAEYSCLICSGKNIATGTQISLQEFFSKKR
jgi:hypothetical protein